MTKVSRAILLTAAVAGFSLAAQAAEVTAPAPAKDPIVQHLKLTPDQVSKINSLHQQMEKTLSRFHSKTLKMAR